MKPSNGKTVWQHEEKRWKPRTLQSAKVFFPAHDFHRPPEEKKEPVFAEPFEVKLARERRERDVRLAELEAKYGRMPERGKPRSRMRHKPKKKIHPDFAKRQLAKIQKLVAKNA